MNTDQYNTSLDALLDAIDVCGQRGTVSPDTVITAVTADSRAVEIGALFVAVRGVAVDGHKFIPKAIEAGAKVIVAEELPDTLPDGVSALRVEKVFEGLTGDRAGLREGDYVVAFNNQRVTSTEQILAIRRDLSVGDQVPIRVYRNGEYLDLMMDMMAEQ